MEERLRLPSSPIAHPDAVLQGDRWRITVLADGLVRIEWSEDGAFEDRASTFALHRDLPVPRFEVLDEPAGLEILTERLHLTYDRGPFTSSGLSVEPRGNVTDWHSVWRFGVPTPNLGGTARTLDDVDGRTPLEPGVLSQVGVTALDDSRSFLFEQDGWVGSRSPGRLDLYVFCYGRDYAAAIRALYAVSGPQPVLPRWALGNWWSRYHRYSADEYLALLDRFDAEGVPFSVAVLDMDWHRVDDVPPQYGSGWTGYSWNRELFPDPRAFLAALHEHGLRVTLNVHPADGVRPFEDAYPAMAEAVGRDPASDLAIPFDITDQRFLTAYLDVLHHPLEDEGVDFWWLDWQQGHHSRLPGVDPLWMLNHFHFLDSGRGGRRPLTFSRYAGPGSHRYPVGFSGDAIITWASLAFQPEFTATASNIGYGWWSHDIGGHLYGVRDDELATRWVQFGVFTPILRLHSSNNPFLVKEPWNYPAESRAAMDEALRLRHRLVPYLHTMNHRAATEGVPLVRPMYHGWPDDERAYRVPNEYLFGSELLVAPITAPRDPITLRGSVLAWLPPGTWTDLVTGTVYDGDRMVELHRGSASIPVLLKAGGVLPLAGEGALDATRNPESLEVVIAPGADGGLVLVEDDGGGAAPDAIRAARTPITWSQGARTLRIGPAEGDASVLPATRTWSVVLLGAPGVTGATAGGQALELAHEASGRIRVALPAAPAGEALEVAFDGDASPRTAAIDEAVVGLLNAAQYGNEAKLALHRVLTADRPAGARLAEVRALGAPDALFGALAELVTARA